MMRKIQIIVLIALTAVVVNSCKKEFDSPPLTEIPVGDLLTIADLRGMYQGTDVRFTEDKSLYATVTMDETSGNIYKNVYVQDVTGAINIYLLNSGGLYEGDSIRINLNGTVLTDYNGVLQLDSVDVDNNVVKQATQRFVSPKKLSISQIDDTWESYLIVLDSVQFANADLGQTYADPVNLYSENRMLENCSGNQVIVRSSGYSSFAGEQVADKNGSFIAIVGEYQGEMQLYIRNPSELTMTNSRCAGSGYLSKNFEDLSVTSGGWTTQVVVGSDDWTADSFGADNFGKITNYDGNQNNASEAWLISPSVDLSAVTNPVLTFRTAYNYTGAPLEVFVSTDYNGTSAPSTATWNALSATLSSGSWAWANSGNIDLSAYSVSGVYIAFKYTGSNSDGSTWEVDDIAIQ